MDKLWDTHFFLSKCSNQHLNLLGARSIFMVSIDNKKVVLDLYMLILFQDKFKNALNCFLSLLCFYMDLGLIVFYQGVTDQTAWSR